jgi:hypothetical protein
MNPMAPLRAGYGSRYFFKNLRGRPIRTGDLQDPLRLHHGRPPRMIRAGVSLNSTTQLDHQIQRLGSQFRQHFRFRRRSHAP